jgi:hypothetical protein
MLVDGYLVNVPASAVAAIRRMRLPDEWRTLWIDAICINQSDLQERGAQVGGMDLVYSMADENLIYLGADDDGVAERTVKVLQETTRQLDNEVKKLDIPVDERQDYEAYGLVTDEIESRVTLSESNIKSLLPLYNLPWFQ